MVASDLFGQVLHYPDDDSQARGNRLFGREKEKERLTKLLSLFVAQDLLIDWVQTYHPNAENVVSGLLKRAPLVVISGDVGTGKTEIAETVPDLVARRYNLELSLYPLTLSARGSGRVGEISQLLTSAFETITDEGRKAWRAEKSGVVLFIDEADALGQSRSESQMHHEDRAGVNSLIRGLDTLAHERVNAAVIMVTNRLSALDPAILRRAADVLSFDRPDEDVRREIINFYLSPFGVSQSTIEHALAVTGPGKGRDYGFTFSDITQRLLPSIILRAFPEESVSSRHVEDALIGIEPTSPFQD